MKPVTVPWRRLALVCALPLSACTLPTGPDPHAAPAVLPSPSPPSWVTSLAPLGIARDGTQIRIAFAHDLLPPRSFEGSAAPAVLAHFSLTPSIAGRFVLLTPRMVGYAAAAAWPHGARYAVRVSTGLRDVAGDVLRRELAWTFDTQPVVFRALPGASGPPPIVGPNPILSVVASDSLEIRSLLAQTRLVDASDGTRSVEVQQVVDDPAAPRAGAPVTYRIQPIAQLRPDRTYRLIVGPGIYAIGGNLPTATAVRGRVQTASALAFTGAAMSGEPGKRFANGEPVLSFTNAVDPASAVASIALAPLPASGAPLMLAHRGGIVTIADDALSPRTAYSVSIASNLADVFGQTLTTPDSAHFTTGDLAPALWAPAGSRIFPPVPGLALEVATVNLPARGFRAAHRVLEPRDLIAHDPLAAARLRAILGNARGWPFRAFEQPSNETVEAALPLRAWLSSERGMLAYGVAGDTLEAAPFVGTVQATDLGVFAELLTRGGLVQVNRFSDGSPVEGATIALFDGDGSHDEPPCAGGASDAAGTFVLDGPASERCARARTLLAIVRSHGDWAYARIASDRAPGGTGASDVSAPLPVVGVPVAPVLSGSIARAVVRSPYADADVYLTVVRDGVLYRAQRHVRGASARFDVPVTDAMLPAASVQALVVRRGPLSAERTGTRLTTFGAASLSVTTSVGRLRLSIAHTPLEPGAAQALVVRLADVKGKPARGDVLLSIVQRRAADAAGSFDAPQPILTRIADNRADVVLATERRTASGSVPAAVVSSEPARSAPDRIAPAPRVSWHARVHIGRSGLARVRVVLPAGAAAWHALAVTAAGRAFSSASVDFDIAGGFAVQPLLPPFARPGDRFSLSVRVANAPHAAAVRIVASASGGANLPAQSGIARLLVPPSGVASIPLVAEGALPIHVRVVAHAAGFSRVRTADVRVIADEALRQTVVTGTSLVSTGVPLDLPASIAGTLGEVRASVSNSVAVDGDDVIADALAGRPAPIAPLLAARIAIANDALALDARYGRTDRTRALETMLSRDRVSLRGLRAGRTHAATLAAPSTAARAAATLEADIAAAVPDVAIERDLLALLALRRAGRWGDPVDDAAALGALVHYARRDAEPPEFGVVTTLPANPPKIVRARLTGYDGGYVSAALPIDEVTRGPAAIEFTKSGAGRLHYAVTASFEEAAPNSGTYAGLRIDRIVRVAGAATPLVTLALAAGDPVHAVPGTVLEVEDRIVTDRAVDNVMVSDPFPGACVPLPPGVRTLSPGDLAGVDALALDTRVLTFDRAVVYAAHLDPGVYAFSYRLRVLADGQFAWPSARISTLGDAWLGGATAPTTLAVGAP